MFARTCQAEMVRHYFLGNGMKNAIGLGVIPQIMENQMDQTMQNNMKNRIIKRILGCQGFPSIRGSPIHKIPWSL